MPLYQNLPQVWRREEERQEAIKLLTEEIETSKVMKLGFKKHILEFLIAEEVYEIEKIDYPLREKFEKQILAQFSSKMCLHGMKDYDRLKQYAVSRQQETLAGLKETRLRYENTILFLPYHPDQQVVAEYKNAAKKKDLVWDFSRDAPEKMKRQIFETLHYIIKNYSKGETKRAHYLGLRKFYEFCIREQVQDIEALELEDIERFREYLSSEKEAHKMMHIVSVCKEVIFMQAKEIHWDAAVWYMERIHVEKWRLNPAHPIRTIPFLEVKVSGNRKLLQNYMKYNIGVTNLAMYSIQQEFAIVKGFFVWVEEKEDPDVCKVSEKTMDQYFKILDEKKLTADTFNKSVMSILHFFHFLRARDYIDKIPFCEEYYLKKTVSKHLNRSVEKDVCLEILQKLHNFPERTRLMFLHLWVLGLRANEVCTIKGDAYYIEGRDPWIKIYQYKMKNYKRTPIPWALYRLMKVYLGKYHIGPEEYAFQNKKGGACSYAVFRRQMLEACEENQIKNGEYLFKAHDYRHTAATQFYDHGVSIQGVRDYLGHTYEDMTRRYLDYMPKKAAKANEEFFSQAGNSLAAKMKKRCQYGKEDRFKGTGELSKSDRKAEIVSDKESGL